MKTLQKSISSVSWSRIILNNIVDRGDNSKFGLAQGITTMVHQVKDIDRQYEYEKIGQQIIDLPNAQWDVLRS